MESKMEGYAVYDETGTIIPITLTATFMVENVAVPIAMRDAVVRFLEVHHEYVAGGWDKAERAGYTVRRVNIHASEPYKPFNGR